MTPLEQALVSLADSVYWLRVAAVTLVPIVVIMAILLFVVIWQIRSDTSYLRHRASGD